MEQFYTLLTDVGKAKIANATALQTKVKFTKLLVGDSNGSYYEPTQDQTKLKNKVWEGGIGNISIDKDNPNWMVLESVIPSNVGGFTIREVGITDEEGDLVIIAKYPQTYKPKIEDGSTKDLTIKTILEVANVECVTLKVDPSIIIATKEDIENVKKEMENNTLSKEDIETTINNIKASDIKTENGQTVESQLDDITNKVEQNNNNILNNTNCTNNFSNYISNKYVTIYVDYENGNNNNDGLSSKTPFKTFDIISKYYKTVDINIIGDYPNNIVISNMNAIKIYSKDKCKGIIIENCKHVVLYLSSIAYLQCYNCDIVYMNGHTGHSDNTDVTSYIDILPCHEHNGGLKIKHSLSFYNCSVSLNFINFNNLETDYFIGASKSLISVYKCVSNNNSNKNAYYCEDSKIYEWESDLTGKISKTHKTTSLYGNEV